MAVLKSDSVALRNSSDIVSARQIARAWSIEVGFGLIDQTKIVTAASELARNTLDYGGGGTMQLEIVQQNMRQGLRLTFQDAGPGIPPDLELALKDGYTTGNGMGLGLSGSRRLMNEFDIQSSSEGTRVSVTRWK